MKGPRSLALLLAIVLVFTAFVSCSEDAQVTHTLYELSFTLPKNMRKLDDENSDAYYSTLECGFSAILLTEERLKNYGIDKSASLEECVDSFFKKKNIDKAQSYLTYSKEQNAYFFRYSISSDGETYYFHYNVFVEGSEDKYFIDMSCEYELANYYLIEFEKWAKTVRAE